MHVFSRSSKCDSRIKHKQGIQARASNHTLAARLQLAGTELPSRGLGLESRSHVSLLAVRKLIGQRPHHGTAYAKRLAEKTKFCTVCHHRRRRRWWQRFAPRLSVATTRRSPFLVPPVGVRGRRLGRRRLRIVLLLRRGSCGGGSPLIGRPRRGSGTRTGSSTRIPG